MNSSTIFDNFDENPFHLYLGLRLIETKPDFVRLRLTIKDTTPTGIGGSVNGGVLSTMVDMAAVPAVFSNMLPVASLQAPRTCRSPTSDNHMANGSTPKPPL